MQAICLGGLSRQYLAGSRGTWCCTVVVGELAAQQGDSGFCRVSNSIQLPRVFPSVQKAVQRVLYIGCKFRVHGHDALALHAGMRWTVERATLIRPSPSFGLCVVSVLLASLSGLEPIADCAGMIGELVCVKKRTAGEKPC